LEQHRPSIRQRVTPLVAVKAMPTTEKPQCEPTLLSVSKTHAIFRCNTCYCLPPGRAGVNVTRSLPSRPSATDPLDYATIADGNFSSVYVAHSKHAQQFDVSSPFSVSTSPAFRHFRSEPLPYSTAHICGRCARRGWCNGDHYSQTPDRAVCDDGMRV